MEHGLNVEYGIQRRTVCLVPPDREELEWIFRQFDEPEVFGSLGLVAPAGEDLRRRHAEGDHVFAIIRAAATQRNIGFAVVFPPSEAFDAWSFAYAICDPRDRNAYHALHATDAMAHYMFEHLRVEAVGFETREGNAAADAIVRRLGYSGGEARVVQGRSFRFYRLDRESWAARRAKLDAGERSHPSGIGGTFVKLVPPYHPVTPRSKR